MISCSQSHVYKWPVFSWTSKLFSVLDFPSKRQRRSSWEPSTSTSPPSSPVQLSRWADSLKLTTRYDLVVTWNVTWSPMNIIMCVLCSCCWCVSGVLCVVWHGEHRYIRQWAGQTRFLGPLATLDCVDIPFAFCVIGVSPSHVLVGNYRWHEALPWTISWGWHCNFTDFRLSRRCSADY